MLACSAEGVQGLRILCLRRQTLTAPGQAWGSALQGGKAAIG